MAMVAVLAPPSASASSSINYGPISHKNMKNLGAASPGLQLSVQLGLTANNSGIQTVVKNASNPSSSSYGKYISLSTLQKSYGASSSKYNAVINAFKKYGVTAKVDVTHLRVGATLSIKNAQKIFGTPWDLYNSNGEDLALPVNTPKPVSGIPGNVDTVAGLRLEVSASSTAVPSPGPVVRSAAFDGGSAQRTGTIDPGCTPTSFPDAVNSSAGLFPNQILTAYGIAPLQAAGLKGQGVNVAIVGEAPTVASDVNTFRNCFGFNGTSLQMHGDTSSKPIIETSLDAMVLSSVAPNSAHFDFWGHSLNEEADDGDVLGFLQMLAQPLQATSNGTPLPNVISVSYGVCESKVSPYSASRTLVERQLAATASLGITTVVAAGDSGSSSCAKGVPSDQLTSADKALSASWPATSPWVLAVGGTNLTLNDDNSIASSGVWNDTVYPSPYQKASGGGGGVSTFESRPGWQPPVGSQSKYRMVPDVSVFADESPGYLVVCDPSVKSCPGAPAGQSITYVGGTSAAAPLVAGMIALWDQQAHQTGAPRPGFVAPLLYSIAKQAPASFLDITLGTNEVFSGLSCCSAGSGFDLASGNGSPIANLILGQLKK
jgi:subtilase family serine protease